MAKVRNNSVKYSMKPLQMPPLSFSLTNWIQSHLSEKMLVEK